MMRRYTLYFLVTTLSVFLLLAACKKEETSPFVPEPKEPVVEMPEPEPESMGIDRKAVLTNYFDNALTLAYTAYQEEAAKFVAVVETFKITPTLSNLEKVQAQWVATKIVWEQAEVFDVGGINDDFPHNRIDKYPVKYTFLEDNLDRPDPIDEAFVTNSGSTAKGLAAIEYLIFRAADGAEILNQFTKRERATQYQNYLLALTQNLVTQGEVLQTALTEERAIFINNTGDGLNTGVNDLVNAQIGMLEEIISSKINKPLGLSNKGLIELDKLESPFALTSLATIKGNIVGLSNSLLADSTQSNLYDLLDNIEVEEPIKLSTSIQTLLIESLALIDNFDTSLSETIQTDKEKVTQLADKLDELLVAIKVDMASRLSVTVVFNDSDGD